LDKLANSPCLGYLSALRLNAVPLGAVGLRTVVESPHLGRLSILLLTENNADDVALGQLANGKRHAVLQRLTLTLNPFLLTRIRHILVTSLLCRLEALRLPTLALSGSLSQTQSVLKTAAWSRLTALHLYRVDFTPETFALWIQCPYLANLTALSLHLDNFDA